MWSRFLRRRWGWLLAGLGGAVLLVLLASWLAFQHVPGWYRPMEVPPDQVQRVQHDLARTADALNERMVRAYQPFEFRVTQDQLNAWIAAREEMWPLAREWLPPGIADPFVSIDEQGIRLAATVQFGSLQTVVGVRLAVTAAPDRLHLKLIEVTSGSLPVPASLVEQQLVSFYRKHGIQLEWPDRQGERKLVNLNGLASEGIDLPNLGVWRQLDLPPREYRVIGLGFEPGVLTLTVQPLLYRYSTR